MDMRRHFQKYSQNTQKSSDIAIRWLPERQQKKRSGSAPGFSRAKHPPAHQKDPPLMFEDLAAAMAEDSMAEDLAAVML